MICDECGRNIDREDEVIYHFCEDCYNKISPPKPVPKKCKKPSIVPSAYGDGEPTTARTPELQGIVNRPQFDTEYFSVGIAVYVDIEHGDKFNGIVLEVFTDKITIGFFDNEGSADRYGVNISKVINGKIKLKKLT